MKGLKLNKSSIPYMIIIGLIIYILLMGRSGESEVVIPPQTNTFTVDAPIAVIKHDTIIEEGEIKIVEVPNPVNKELLSKYEKAVAQNDSLTQLKLYKEAITERQYCETFEDSVQVINVESNVIGTLKSQTIIYRTKERVVKMPSRVLKPSIFVGGFTYDLRNNPSFGARLSILNKDKNKIFNIGYDHRKRVHIGLTLKLF